LLFKHAAYSRPRTSGHYHSKIIALQAERRGAPREVKKTIRNNTKLQLCCRDKIFGHRVIETHNRAENQAECRVTLDDAGALEGK
jgi:hypothetical protein